jgi:hypothetical protein
MLMLLKRGWAIFAQVGWAIFAVPAIFWIYVLFTYRFAARHGHLPYQVFPLWLWVAIYFALIASGALAVARLPLSRMWVRVGLTMVYIAAMAVVLLVLSFNASCTSGDCL